MSRVYEGMNDNVRAVSDVVTGDGSYSLYILRTVDEAVDVLSSIQSRLTDDLKVTQDLLRRVESLDPRLVIDPDDSLCDGLLRAQTVLESVDDMLRKKRQECLDHTVLNSDHKDALVCEFDRAIAVNADVHNTLNTLRWTVMEHDADLSPVSASFDNIDDLIADLNS